MSKRIEAAAVATILAFPVMAEAQGFELSGGSVKLGYSAFTEEVEDADGDDIRVDRSTIAGSVEMAISPFFAMQGDLTFHDFGVTEINARGAALHGIVHATPSTSVGIFVGRENLENYEVNFAGVEAGLDFGRANAEAFFATGEYDDVDGNYAGISGEFQALDWLAFTASAERADFDLDLEIESASIGARVGIGGVDLTAEYGQADVDALGVKSTDDFVKLGAEYRFGANRGATFGARSLGNLIPGL